MQTNHSYHTLASQFPHTEGGLEVWFCQKRTNESSTSHQENHSLPLENREDTLASLPVIYFFL